MLNIKNGTRVEFLNDLKDKRIVIIGAGRLLKECMLAYDLGDKDILIADFGRKDADSTFTHEGCTFPILNERELLSIAGRRDKPLIVLISTSIYFADIIKILDQYDEFNNVDCYLHVLIRNRFSRKIDFAFTKGKPIIPKKIHYCWFGGAPIPKRLQKLMDTWKKHNPDYEFFRWDETNYDISKNRYMREAYECKAWGFVPDYARLDIIWNEGGIYLDTDVEVFAPFDKLLNDRAFFGFADAVQIVSGIGFAAAADEAIIKDMRDYYDNFSFFNKDGTQNRMTCVAYQAPVFKKYGFSPFSGQYQKHNGVVVYPSMVLCPYPDVYLQDYVDDAYDPNMSVTTHRFARTWFAEKELSATRQGHEWLKTRLKQGLKSQK